MSENMNSNEPEKSPFADFDLLQKLQYMLDHIPQSVFWKDRNSQYVWVNKRCVEDWGVASPEDLVGYNDLFDLRPWTIDQANAYLKDDQEVMETGKPKLNIIEPQRRSDGAYAWLNTSKVPLFDDDGQVIGLMGTYEDITERAHAEIILRRDQRMLETIFNSVPIAIVWKDTMSRFMGCNNLFAQNAGISPREIVGKTDFDMPWGEEHAAEYIADDQEVMQSGQPRLQYIEQLRYADGTLAWIQTNKVPLQDADGLVTGILVTYQDITNQISISEELREMRTTAKEERQKLARDLHDAVSQTLWTASIIADILPSLWEHDQAKGRRSLQQLQQLTQGALAELRMLLLELRPSSLIATSFQELLEHLAEATMSRKEIDIEVTVNKKTSLPIDTRLALYRIAQESLNNISRHSKATKARIAVSETDTHLILLIEDNGRGFDLAARGTKRMGLSIMEERAEAIQAEIDISSRGGEGTTIIVRWPIVTTRGVK